MRKIVSMLLCAVFFTAIPVCGFAANPKGDKKPSVVATIFPPYDLARAVAGGHAEITMLLKPGTESHSFEPTPQDIVKIQNCDIFIYGGGESDEWVKGIFESLDASKMKIISMLDCVDAVEEEIVEGMQDEEEEEDSLSDTFEGHDHEEEYDEHVWTSPKNAKSIAQKISDTLAEVDPTNAGAYKNNAAAFLESLDKLDAAFGEVVKTSARKTLVFGDRFPFRYFADAYGLDYFAAFPGCATETEASAATIAFLIDKVKAEKIPVVFHIELSNEKIADAICEATGAKKLLLHAVHNITNDDFRAGATYLGIMTANIDALKTALN